MGVISMQIAIKERRQAQRENLSEPVLICPCDPEYPEEVCTTLNVSRNGLYFATTTEHYFPGMNVIVTLNFHSGDPMPLEYIGDVVRLERLEDGKWGVAIRILMRYNAEVYSGT
jgi:PilZ domain